MTLITVNQGDNLQAKLDSAVAGDIVELSAAGTWDTPGLFQSFTLTKNCPANNRITVRSSAYASLPSGRVSPSDAVNMPTIRGVGSAPVFLMTGASAGGYVLDGLHITANCTGAAYVNAGIDLSTGRDVDITRCYIHPPETEQVVWDRSMERAIACGATNVLVKWNYGGPFVGYPPNSDHSEQFVSEFFQCVYSPGPINIIDNYMEAHYAAIFLGGGDAPPAHTTTMTSVTGTTGGVLASTTHLAAGLILRVKIQGVGTLVGDNLTYVSGSTLTEAGIGYGITVVNQSSGTSYYNGVLQSVTGNVYGITTPQDPPDGTYTYYLFTTVKLDTVNGGTGAVTWTPYGTNALTSTPATGSEVAWSDGDESMINDVLVQGNTVHVNYPYSAHRLSLPGASAPKGYWEVKSCNRMTVEGNHFTGFPSTPVWFALNQAGTAPWSTTKNLIVRNNYFQPETYGSNGPALIYATMGSYDGTGDLYTTTPGGNLEFYNNLGINIGMLAKISGGSNVLIRNNTIIAFNVADYNAFVTSISRVGGTVEIRDNIGAFNAYGIQCAIGALATCWPGTITIQKNLLIDVQNVGIYPGWYQSGDLIGGPVPTTFAAVGFTNQAAGNYRLTGTYAGTGTAGGDPGIDQDVLEGALGFTINRGVVVAPQVRANFKMTII